MSIKQGSLKENRFWARRIGNKGGPDKNGSTYAIRTFTYDEVTGERNGEAIIKIITGQNRLAATRYVASLNNALISISSLETK